MKKILIDTNIILRLLIGDIPEQLTKAREIFEQIEKEKTTGFISILVVNELIWILEYFYKKERSEYLPVIMKLLSLKNVRILEFKKQELSEILKTMGKSNLDFTDLYLAHQQKLSGLPISTFDKKLLSFSEAS